MTIVYKPSFNNGILTPRAGGRIDLTKYESSVAQAENVMPQPWGGITRSMGTEYIDSCLYSDKRARLIPFRYSTTQAYVIEVGDEYMRFFMNGGVIYTNDASTMFLAHYDGNDASQSLTDSGPTGHTITVNGNAKIDASDGVFNQSLIYDGNASYIEMADSSRFSYGANTFCLEKRFKVTSDSGRHVLYSQRIQSDHIFWYYDAYSHELCFYSTAGGANQIKRRVSWTATADTWYDARIIRGWGGNPTSWAMTIEGVAVDTWTYTGSLPDVSAVVTMGSFGTATTIDVDLVNQATCQFNGSATISRAKTGDSSSMLKLVAASSDHLVFQDSANWDLCNVANYTIYFEISLTNHAGSDAFMEQYADVDNKWAFYHKDGTGCELYVRSAAAAIIDVVGGEITDSSVHKIALVKVGTDWGIYIDGVQTAYSSDASTVAIAGSLYIGRGSTAGASFYCNGYMGNIYMSKSNKFSAAPNVGKTDTITMPDGMPTIDANTVFALPCDLMDMNGHEDECRISKDARQTATFVPPTVAYPLGSSGGGTSYQITTPYQESDLRDIYYTQSADTLYPTHPTYVPRKLVRNDHDSWTLSSITFDWPPFMDGNYASVMMLPSATTGAVTVQVSTGLFTTSYVSADIRYRGGYFNIASIQSATQCTGNVIKTLGAVAWDDSWALSSWNGVNGYPACVTFFEQRLCYAATDKEEAKIWMSVSGDYYNHNPKVGSTIVDTDAVQYSIDSGEINKINWLVPSGKLFAGTAGDVFMLSGNQDDGITPSNIKCRSAAAEQSADEIMPIRIGNSVMFVEYGGHNLRELAYELTEDAYRAKNILILAEHLTRNNTIVEMSLQRIPFKVIWCVLDDGNVLSLTYLKEHDVIGWTKRDFGDGFVESVAVIPGNTDDEVWFIVKRTINGSVVRYIERLKPAFTGSDVCDSFYVDCGLTYDSTATSTISGLDHLAGETVMFMADAERNESTKVTAAGIIHLDIPASCVHVGLKNEATVQTLRVSTAQFQGTPKRISNVTIRFFETAGEVSIGVPGKMDTKNFGSTLFTGDHKFTFPSGYDNDGQITITKEDGYPMTILAIIPDIEMYR